MSSFPVTLLFSDGAAARIDCRSFESVVQAAARHNIRLLVDCREGGCGTCKAIIQAGEFNLDDYSQEALSDAELAEGRILTCRMWPKSPCVVEFDYPLTAVRRGAPAAARPARIVEIAQRADVVVEVAIEAEDGRPFSFLPGQYVNLQIPGTEIVRSYSFVNQPEATRATFLLRLISGGALSEWIKAQSAPGASLLVTGPFGRFFMRDASHPLVFVAGGTGIGPIVSIMERMRAAGIIPPSLKLVFGVNTLGSLFYRERLEELVSSFPNSEMILAVMSPAEGWDGVTGTAVDALKTIAVDPVTQVYLCGPPIMTEHAQTYLRTLGIGERAMFCEAFLPALDSKAA